MRLLAQLEPAIWFTLGVVVTVVVFHFYGRWLMKNLKHLADDDEFV